MPDPNQFPLTVTSGKTTSNRTGTWRANRPVYVQQTPPCREACTAGEDIARWIDLLRGREYRRAWGILVEDNPFPATMGRVCIHPCQSNCNRGHHDESMGINSLEQFLGDRALEEGWAFTPPAQERAQHLAVVGGGPADLSCAYQLRRMGYQVTIFEAGERLGGLLTYALPEYQLPARAINAEIQRIVDLGVQIRFGERVGQTISWEDLRHQYQAVFIAVGAPQVPSPNLPGKDLPGVTDGLSFMAAVKAGRTETGGHPTVVIGAGLTGIETARTLRRLGAEVTVVTAEPADRVMLPDRVHEAETEGVTFIFGADVQSLIEAGGAVAGVQLADRTLPAGAVILATGRTVKPASFPDGAEVDVTRHLSVNPFTGETNMPGVFAGGDATGTRYTVEAIGAGKKGAAAVHAYLQQQDVEQALAGSRLGYSPNLSMRYYLRPESYPQQLRVKLNHVVAYEEIEAIYFGRQSRIHRSKVSSEFRTRSFSEVRLGLTEEQALAESSRCFNCGTCIGCDNCLIFCPDMAISKTTDGAAFNVDWDHCKGCGACVQECPREALILEEEIK